jgi:outer membrane protein assembly factor BamB
MDSAPLPERGRPWFPILVLVLVLVLVLAALTWAWTKGELEQNIRIWFSLMVTLLAVLLTLLWALLSSRFSVRRRLGVLGALLLLGMGFRATLRVDGTLDGRGLPRLAWKGFVKGVPAPLGNSRGSGREPVPAGVIAGVRDVPEFFGFRRTGSVSGSNLSTHWTTTPPRELWRQPVGRGWSGFAVVGGKAYTQEQREDLESVVCYDLLTGQPLWTHGDSARFDQWQGGEGPRSTPTVADGRIYSYGATGLLNCLEASTGKTVWQRRVLEDISSANLEWGLSASPLVLDSIVVVTGGGTRGPVLLAYRRDSGEPVWKSGEDVASYSSPRSARLLGQEVLVSNNARSLTLHDPQTGAVLVELEWGSPRFPKASQPVVVGEDRIFVSAGYGMGCRMYQFRREATGRWLATELWKGNRMKTQFNSPSLRGTHLYGLDDGFLACVDIQSGDRLWKDGRFGSGQSLLVDDLVVVQNERGSVHLCGAGPDGFREFGSLPALSSKTWNLPTVAGRYLLVRNDREAACFELPVR